MFLKKITVTNFRNYDFTGINPGPGINFITGPNAAGKTNFLEAVFFIGRGYSFRNSYRDMIKWGKSTASVVALFDLHKRSVEIKAEVNLDGRKNLLVDGVENKRHDLPGRFGIILFRPDDLQIIKGPPVQRRNFLDNELCIVEPFYREVLSRYRRVLVHRNNLLRNGPYINKDLLGIWNEELFKYGSQLLYMRVKLLKKFFPLVKKAYNDLAGNKEKLEMKYLSTVRISAEPDLEKITNYFRTEGKAREKEELYKGQTILGPHRDDMAFYLDGVDARQYASQGQVRSIVLAIKTAQVRFLEQLTGEQPILLLDDVLMELDEYRQNYLMNMICGKIQSFITSALGLEKFRHYEGKIYLVDGCKIREVM